MTFKPTKEALLAELAAANQKRRPLTRRRDPAGRAEHAAAFAVELAVVAALREQDTTWQEIADLLGRKKPNVIALYRPHLEETRTVRVKPPAS